MLDLARRVLPDPFKQFVKRTIPYYRRCYCPVCRRFAHAFDPHGLVPRPEARCPNCGSLERHRLVWLVFTERTTLFDPTPKRMLHVALEGCLAPRFQAARQIEYLSADLSAEKAMVSMDLTDIQYPEASFDVIYCSHVLEHIPADQQAMREMSRVLAPGGWAVLMVPITAPETIEDPSITDPAERERRFGQWDHVRRYGSDIAGRLARAGFAVECIRSDDFISSARRQRYRIPSNEGPVFLCRKVAAVH